MTIQVIFDITENTDDYAIRNIDMFEDLSDIQCVSL